LVGSEATAKSLPKHPANILRENKLQARLAALKSQISRLCHLCLLHC
jgi:hypothetical protein